MWSYKFGNISSVSMSRGGSYVIVGCHDSYYYIFDKFGNNLRSDNVGSRISSVNIAKNSNFIVGTENRYLFLSMKGTDLGSFESEEVLCLDLSDDGNAAIFGTADRIYIWVETEKRFELYIGSPISNVSLSSTGEYCVAEGGGYLYIFDLIKNEYSAFKLGGTVDCLKISESGRYCVYGTREGILHLYDIKEDIIFEYELGYPIVDVDISESKNSILTGTTEGSLFLFNFNGFNLEKIWDQILESPVKVCRISSDGLFCVVGTVNGKIWFLNSFKNTLWKFSLDDEIAQLVISENGEYLVVASEESLFFFALTAPMFENTRYFPYSSRQRLECGNLVNVWSQPGERKPVIGDVNGDGKKEIILVQDYRIRVFNLSGEILWESNKFNDSLRLGDPIDVTGDTILDITASYYKEEKLFLEFYEGTGNRIKSLVLDLTIFEERQKGLGEASIFPIALQDSDGDGHLELICRVDTGYPLHPRGVIFFDYESGEYEFYPMAPHPIEQGLVDIDGDGMQELLLGCDAPCNGAIVEDTDDCHAYIFVLNLQGKELWKKEIGSGQKRVRFGLLDINEDEKKEIICAAYCSDKNWGQLLVLDSKGNTLHEETFNYSMQWGGTADFKEGHLRGILFIAFGPTFGELRLYDTEFNIISVYEYGENLNESSTLIINDVDGDGSNEILLIPTYPEIIILDENLKEVGKLPLTERPKWVFMDNLGGCRNDLIIWSDRVYVFSFEYENEQPCIPWVKLGRELSERAYEHIARAESAIDKMELDDAIIELESANKIFKDLCFEKMREGTNYFVESLRFLNSLGSSNVEKARNELEEACKFFDRDQEIIYINNLLTICDIIYLGDRSLEEGQKLENEGNYKDALKKYEESKNMYEKIKFESRVRIAEEKIRHIEIIQIQRMSLKIVIFISFCFLVLYAYRTRALIGLKYAIRILLILIGVSVVIGLAYVLINKGESFIESSFAGIITCMSFILAIVEVFSDFKDFRKAFVFGFLLSMIIASIYSLFTELLMTKFFTGFGSVFAVFIGLYLLYRKLKKKND